MTGLVVNTYDTQSSLNMNFKNENLLWKLSSIQMQAQDNAETRLHGQLGPAAAVIGIFAGRERNIEPTNRVYTANPPESMQGTAC